MTVQTLTDSNLFYLAAPGKPERVLSKVFCCDLLSIAMGKAPSDSVWVTVMGNKNTLAVASLADVACVILAEGVTFSKEELDCAREEGIAVYTTNEPVFEAALKVHQLL